MSTDPHHGLYRDTFALVLAGGRGSRLHELTEHRAKPAVPFAGKLQIIDFPLSNCVNSGIRRIGVLTQYKAQSLIRHIERGWSFLAATLGEYVDVVPAQQQHGERHEHEPGRPARPGGGVTDSLRTPDDRFAGLGQPIEHEVSADEAGAAGDENSHG